MGIAHVHRGRLAPALILMVLVALVAFGALLVTEQASAQPTFTTCAGCHSKADTHSKPAHVGVYPTCSNCHVNGDTSVPPTPAKCAACHGGVTTILGKPTHTTQACGTTAGCHGVTAPTPPPATVETTTVSVKMAPAAIKLGKKVKASGVVTPVATLAGKKVAVKVERKAGTKWVKAKSAGATVSATGAYSWSYKPTKKGTYRTTASIAATATYKASKATKTFKVK
jgi:hypothetical protein